MRKLFFLWLLLFLPFPNLVFGQIPDMPKPFMYRNLVLEGGGVRGIAYGGALGELEKRGILQQITRVGGTSAGAIQAALLSVGYSPEEIAKITYETPVKKFNDGRLIFFGGFHRLFKQYGWYRGDVFSKWIGQLLAQKTGSADITFAQLHGLTKTNSQYRDLYVLGTNLSTQKPEVFSHETYPNMKVRDAVRISMSIPLYFRAVLINPEGEIVKKAKKGEPVQVIVDGGILANYPITLFDDPKYFANPANAANFTSSGGVFSNPETIGIRLDRDEQIEFDLQQKGMAPYPIHDFSDYIGAFYNLIIEGLNRQTLTPQDWERTISVSTAGFGPKIKRMSEADKQKLWESGKAGAIQFFEK